MAAGRNRLRANMSVNEAKARCAALRVLPWDDVAIADAIHQVTAALLAASPQVTPVAGAPGTWWVGASGFSALGGEAILAQTLRDIARRWHPATRVAIADSCVAARAATWDMRRESAGTLPVVIPSGACAAYLADVPLGLIPMDEEIRETLVALGIRTAGPLAALAAEDVERRWGSRGLAAWRLARGDDPRRPVLARFEQARAVTAELSPSVSSIEPILFLVRAALDRLVRELIGDGRAAAVVAITLTLDEARGKIPGQGRAHTITREIRLPRPLARVVPLLERCRALLEQWKLTAPVCVVQVAVTASAPLLGEQGELLDPAWRDPAAADAAFARLRSELGPHTIVRPVVRDEHRPEHAGGWEDVTVEWGVRGEGFADHCGPTRYRWPNNGPEIATVPPVTPSAGPPPEVQGTLAHRQLHHHSIVEHSISLPTTTGLALSRPRPHPHPHDGPTAGLAHGALGSTDIHGGHHLPHLPAFLPISVRTTWPSMDGDRSRPAFPGHPSPPPPLRLVEAPVPVMLELAVAFRHLEIPEPVTVECVAGRPRALWWRGQYLQVPYALGPERLAGDWWKDPYTRDYWRCEQDVSSACLLVFHERRARPTGQWYVQGWYD